MSLEIIQLKQFVALARTRNFTRAAEELNLSQPALSRSIQKLEEQVAQPLFERKPREVILTDLGELLLERAKEILRTVEDTLSLLRDEGQQGRIHLGIIPTIAPYFLPELLRRFAESFPQISVVVEESPTEDLVRKCNHGEIDLAILALPVYDQYLECEELFEEELLLCVAPDHELLQAEKVTVAEVVEYPFILLNETHCLSENVEAFCRRQLLQTVQIKRISQLATVQELVALGHGVSIIPQMASALDSSQRCVYRSFTGERPSRAVAMIWNPYRHQSKWVQAFQNHLRKHYQGK